MGIMDTRWGVSQAVNAEKSNDSLAVERDDNHIYFYSDVDAESCLNLIRLVRKVDIDLRTQRVARGLEGITPTPIWLHISSNGGSLFTGMSTADQLAMIESPVYAVGEGVVASAATLILMACSKRYMLPNSFLLVHQLSAFAFGTYEQFKDEMELQHKAMERLVGFYVGRSKRDEAQIRAMLARDFWMDAETAVEYGFVDEVMAR